MGWQRILCMHWEASPVLGSTDLPVTDEIHSVHRLVGKHTHTQLVRRIEVRGRDTGRAPEAARDVPGKTSFRKRGRGGDLPDN